MAEIEYIGGELELFAEATNWKRYFTSFFGPYIHGDVLEVGAGIGTNTRDFLKASAGQIGSWTLLEPDSSLLDVAKRELQDEPVDFKVGTIQDLERTFDTLVYIDVLEHIRDSRLELELAYQMLNPGGRMIVLVPAFQMLYNEFDASIGHYRRYTKKRLIEDFRTLFDPKELAYFDCLGFGASVANKLILRKPVPSKSNVRFWDRILVPLSRIIDRLLFRAFGKSLLAVLVKRVA